MLVRVCPGRAARYDRAMTLTILGYTLGTLPAWLPVWAVPVAMVHVALFLALIVPAWVGLARARSGGPLSLVLVLPILGLLMLTPKPTWAGRTRYRH